ncbi:MAG: hypothetical protein MN733_20625 [Nitrososphaera sp.]|nr:hypothetical protein [Nitrososphaera sp.]
MTVKIYAVGGAVRDELLGIKSKDIDFVVIAESFVAMRNHLLESGFKIFVEHPEFATIRCNVPSGHYLRELAKDTDFVLARKDGFSSDGRRPDYVEAGTLHDDLSRRDFTMNAIAKDPVSGELIDPFHGQSDIQNRRIKFVGDPMQRIREDGLRSLRGFRFAVTKGFWIECETLEAMQSNLAIEMLSCVSIERVREEIEKMFLHDTLRALEVIQDHVPPVMYPAIFREGLRLSATLRAR